MALDDDINDWAPGQPPPWLAAYGDPLLQMQTLPGELAKHAVDPMPPPATLIDPTKYQGPPGGAPVVPAAGGPSSAPVGNPNAAKSTMGPKGRHIEMPGASTGEEVPLSAMPDDSPVSLPPPVAPELAGSPAPGLLGKSQPSFVPPWLAQQQEGQPAQVNTSAPLQSDAISGGEAPKGEDPAQALVRITLDPNAQIEDRQKAFVGLSPEQRANIVNTADPKQLAAIATATMSPEELATITVRHQQAQLHEQSAAQLALAQKADEDARRNYQTYQLAIQHGQQQTAHVEADAKALSQQKIDPNEHGIGHFIASVLTSAVGGAMSQYTGGRNLALEELDKRTQARIEAQTADIQNQWKGLGMRQNLVADQLQRSGDMYRAQETYRVSQYDRAISELQTKMQDYDPQGTTALRLAGSAQQIAAARQASLEAVTQRNIKNYLDLSKQVGESAAAQAIYNRVGPAGLTDATIAKTRAEADKTQAEAAKLRGALGGGAKVKPEDYVSPEELAAIKQATGIEFAPGATRKEVNARLGTTKNAQETAKVTQETASGGNASIVSKPHGDFAPITDKAGNPIRIAPDVAKELNASNIGAQNVVSGLNDVKRLLEEGPSSFDRDKWGEIQARIGQSMAAMTEYYGAKFSKREEEAIKDITNLDFDGYVKRIKDRGPALASIGGIVDTMKQAVDTKNSAVLHTPVSGMLSDIGSAPKPKPTVVDKLASQLATPANPETRRDWHNLTRGELIGRYLTNDEQGRLAYADQIDLAYKRAMRLEEEQGPEGQKPASKTERTSQLDQLAAVANATIRNEKGRWYLVDENGKDISDVQPADTQEAGQVLLSKYRDTARAHLAKLAADAEDETVRDRAGELVQGFTLQNVGTPEEVP